MTLTKSRITNAAEMLTFLQDLANDVDLRNVYVLDSRDAADVVEAALISERLTDNTHVHNVILTLRQV